MAFAEALIRWHQKVDADLNARLEDINREQLELAEDEARIRTELQKPKDFQGVKFDVTDIKAVSDFADQNFRNGS